MSSLVNMLARRIVACSGYVAICIMEVFSGVFEETCLFRVPHYILHVYIYIYEVPSNR